MMEKLKALARKVKIPGMLFVLAFLIAFLVSLPIMWFSSILSYQISQVSSQIETYNTKFAEFKNETTDNFINLEAEFKPTPKAKVKETPTPTPEETPNP